ncbi:MAG: tail fiber domain-containing protein [Bacteroidetes bacterium]|nr:tail fiber domain-containing protein [Bacteroidota bacterium]
MNSFYRIVFAVIVMLMLADVALAQVPRAFHYQAVARDAQGEIIANQAISVQVRLIKGSETGDVVYTETHATTTSPVGSFTLEIGNGIAAQGNSVDSIDLTNDSYFLGMGIDVTGGNDFVDLGATRLLSVPYAIAAAYAMESGGAAEFPRNISLDTAVGDTSIIVRATGPTSLTAFRSIANTDNRNTGLSGQAISRSGSTSQQTGLVGVARGEGTGKHLGVLGSAIDNNGTGGRRYGIYGQASSQGLENIGGFGFATGQGTGEVVPEGQEVNGNVGTVNAGIIGWGTGSPNYNIGVRGRAYGNTAQRVNVGVQATADATSPANNVGFDAFVFGSPANNFGLRGNVFSAGVENYGVSVSVREGSRNVGLQAGVDGSGHNTGLRLFVDRNGTSSIGAEIHADTALVLYGYTTSDFGATFSGLQINGDINYSGSLNNTSDRNLKENIRPIGDALGVVMQLNPTSYTFRGNGSWYGLPLSTGTHYGLIAQEVEAILPALVRDNVHTYTEPSEEVGPSGGELTMTMEYKSLNYTELIPFLIKAIQEQQVQIEALQAEIERLNRE